VPHISSNTMSFRRPYARVGLSWIDSDTIEVRGWNTPLYPNSEAGAPAEPCAATRNRAGVFRFSTLRDFVPPQNNSLISTWSHDEFQPIKAARGE
jgi:hypothetical protein